MLQVSLFKKQAYRTIILYIQTDPFVGKTLLHGDVLMWLMKTLLTSGCTNQRGAGQIHCTNFSPTASASLRMLPEQHAAEARYPIPVEDFRFSIFTVSDSSEPY